jgi:acetyl esterase
MIDPELAELVKLIPPIDLSDAVAARARFEAMLTSIAVEIPGIGSLDISDRFVPGFNGDPDVGVRVYVPKDQGPDPVPGIITIHGGGFIIGSVELEHAGSAMMALQTGSVVVSVEYRLAPEHRYPAALHDCYAALLYVQAHAAELGVDLDRLVLTGVSAGGGLAAATALFARDQGGPPICFQMLHIPELDDRLETPSMVQFTDSPMWNRPLAEVSWQAYLGEGTDREDVSPYAAPSRAVDLSGLPPTYISTAEMDPLRDEGILYGLRLLQAGVSVELHQFPGTFHGSAMVVSAAISQRSQKESIVVLRRALGLS